MSAKLKHSVDKKIFRNTAKKTRAINLHPRVSRGGIRLWLFRVIMISGRFSYKGVIMIYKYRLLVRFLDFVVFDGYYKSLDNAVRSSLNFSDDCTFFIEKEYPIEALREVIKDA